MTMGIRSADTVSPDELSLTVIFREFNEEDEGRYFVAECLDIAGCVSQGKTLGEAQANITDAIRECLAVIFEDSVRHAIFTRTMPDLTGNVVSQSTVSVPVPRFANIAELECA